MLRCSETFKFEKSQSHDKHLEKIPFSRKNYLVFLGVDFLRVRETKLIGHQKKRGKRWVY